MKKKNNSLSLIKRIGQLIKSKKPKGKYDRLENHQPSWMYRNE